LSAEAWLAKGAVAQAVDNDLWLARAAFERSLTLDSLSPEAWHFYGFLYASDCRTCLADYGRAAPLFRRALALDPTLRNSWRLLGMAALHAGRLADAEALLDTALTLGPWTSALLQRAYVRFTRGNGEGALADLTAAERLDSVPRPDQRALYRVLLGDSAPARVVLARLRTQANSGQPNERDLARFSMALGMLDEVLAAMQHLRTHVNPDEPRCSPKATCSPSIATWLLLHEPIFASLHGDPRFERLWEDTHPRVPWQAGYH
jgi:tetratricopeptide (TPR) repeat protein